MFIVCCSRKFRFSIEYLEEIPEEIPEQIPEIPEQIPEQIPEIPEQIPEIPEQIPEIPEQILEQIPEQIPEPKAHKKPNYNHHYWPSPRAVLFVKYLYVCQLKKPSPPRLTHAAALEILANYAQCSVEDLLKINPLTYIEKCLGNTKYLFAKSIIDSREYTNLQWRLAYEAKQHKAETQESVE